MKKPAIRAWTYAADQPWVITEASLRQILEIAARTTEESWEAVAAKMGKPLESTWGVETRNGVAVVPVSGPIFRYANLFTMFSGGTSVQDLATDFQAAVDNPAVKAILLNVDSPGGEVSGINEMAAMIRSADQVKPVVAYVGGTAASGGYWLASQAREIVTDPTALLGSIGVVATIRDTKARDEKAGISTFEIVSSQSPNKRLDPGTDVGRAAIQVVLDDLAAEFIGAVAAGRGVTPEAVVAKFGAGGMMTAKRAIAAGMADRIGSFESVLAELSTQSNAPAISLGGAAANSPKGVHMDDPKNPAANKPAEAAAPPVDVEAVKATAKAEGKTEGKAEGKAEERTRIKAILSSEESKGRTAQAITLATETDLDVESAKKVLASAPKESSNPLASAMAAVQNPKVGVDAGAGADDDEKSMVAGVLAFVPGRKH